MTAGHTYYLTTGRDTLFRRRGPGYNFEAWIDGEWRYVVLSEQDWDGLIEITEEEARRFGGV